MHIFNLASISLSVDLLVSSKSHQPIHRPPTASNIHQILTKAKHRIYKPKEFLTSISLLEPAIVQYALNILDWKEIVQS